MRLRSIATLLLCTCALPSFGQDRPAAILVLDGSGSMWGQIDGTAKITIAQGVVADLLVTLPAEQHLGLTVYGHRRKGDCSDIETLVAPGPDTRADIAQAVKTIKPKGKTPMADAVVEAARALRHTEEPATVILVSDGIETCAPDVCAVARALEQSGVDFTAHVVGFDVSDAEARAQFQCMADSTGGQFLSATDAASLSAALQQVSVAAPKPEPAPKPGKIRFSALEKFGQTTRAPEVVWEIFAEDGSIAMDAVQTQFGETELPAGAYRVQVMRLADERLEQRSVAVKPGDTAGVEVIFESLLPPAHLTAPTSGQIGDTISVNWTGPGAEGDYIDTALVGSTSESYETYENVFKGNPLDLRLPAQPGDYEIRYVLAEGLQVLARSAITVEDRGFSVSAPASAPVGALIEVPWSGGGFEADYLAIAPAGSGSEDYVTYEYVNKGNPAPLRLPLTPGAYDLRYIVGQDLSVAASQPIELTDIAVALTAPARVAAGSAVEVSHTGPSYDGDYITFVRPDAGALDYLTYEYTRGAGTVTVPAPEEPGTYELRYVSVVGDARVFAAQTVEVE